MITAERVERFGGDWVGVLQKALTPVVRSASRNTDNTPLHKAADANYRQMMLVISAAFMRGRKALRGPLRAAGGPGSGNFGHAGRPGEVGGSSGEIAYHGTGGDRVIESILKEGIRPAGDSPGPEGTYSKTVYMTSSRERAEYYADPSGAATAFGGSVAVFEVHIPPEAISRFGKTSSMVEGNPTIYSFNETIPPQWIKAVSVKIKGSKWSSLKTLASGDLVIYVAVQLVSDLRSASHSPNISSCISAIRQSLEETLPPVLLKTMVAGGQVGIEGLRKLRVATSADIDAECLTSVCEDCGGSKYHDKVCPALLRGLELRTLKPKPFDKRRAMPVKKGALSMRFDVKSPTAIKWAREHAAELAKELSETSEKRIKAAVASALEGDGIDAAYDVILSAVGDEARADMIARTEIMTAANQGQRESWDQAVEAGLLPPDARVAWIATSGACAEICEPMDGVTRALDDEDYDGQQAPPAHPNCRCTEGITDDAPRALGGPGSGNFGHSGRPGEVGGSSSEGGQLTQDSFKSPGADSTGTVRERAAVLVAKRADISVADLQALADVEGITLRGTDHEDNKRIVVENYMQQWAGSSGGPAVEQMARSVVAERLQGQAYQEPPDSEGSQQFMRDNPQVSNALGAIGISMYDETQEWLRERGIKEVSLQRAGTSANNRLHTSWSTGWAGVRHESGRAVVTERVPAKYIWSVPSTGFGTLAESEVVVLPRPKLRGLSGEKERVN